MVFKPWLIHRSSKAQKNNESLRQSVGYNNSKYIGIVYTNNAPHKIDAADKLSTLLKMEGKKVKILAYERNNSIKHLPYDTITPDNFSFWGSFKGKPLEDFVKAEFDFLICIDEQPNTLVRCILAYSKAKCRVGRHEESNEPSFEMLVQNGKGENIDWIDSIYHYLKIIA